MMEINDFIETNDKYIFIMENDYTHEFNKIPYNKINFKQLYTELVKLNIIVLRSNIRHLYILCENDIRNRLLNLFEYVSESEKYDDTNYIFICRYVPSNLSKDFDDFSNHFYKQILLKKKLSNILK